MRRPRAPATMVHSSHLVRRAAEVRRSPVGRRRERIFSGDRSSPIVCRTLDGDDDEIEAEPVPGPTLQ